MQTLQTLLEKKTTAAIERAFKGFPIDSLAEIAQCVNEANGHYQCNSALKLAKVLKKNPRKVAEEILSHFDPKTDSGQLVINKMEVAGPGFINFMIDKAFLSKRLDNVLHDPNLGISIPDQKKKIIVEFSSPNIAKELHVGHLRSTIIGESLARLFEFLGHNVLRLNHIGDWGTQFGMLIAFLKKFHPTITSGEKKAELPELMHWYKEAKKLFDEDAVFKKESQFEVVSLQKGDQTSLKAWMAICNISRKAFQEIYSLLEISLEERGESFYNPLLPEVISEAEKSNVVEISEGAKCIYPPGFMNREGNPLPLMIQKSDGGYNYDTTDMAALKHRIEEEKADRIIVVTDAGQSLHFQLVFKAAEMVGFYDPKKVQLDHVTFGLVLGPDGKKFKTRSGTTEKLIDLIYEGVDHAYKLLEEKIPEMEECEKKELAKNLGIAAIKYADLSSVRTKDYVFSYDRMLRFEGNTAVFLLYAYVRIMGIKRKANINIDNVMNAAKISLNHPSEISLGLHLLRFSEALKSVEKDLMPNRLADYLYELAEKFNAFFRDCRVIGDSEMNSRLLLCEVCGKVLKQGLFILGINTVEKM